MTGASISVKIDDAQVQEAFKRLLDAGQNTDAVLRDIGEYLLISHDQRFSDQVSPDGDAWEPLKPAYKKRKKYHPDKILILNNFLRSQLVYDVGNDELSFGTNSIYGATHQFGDDDRGIPARPFLGVSADDEKEILNILQDWLDRVI